MTRPNKRFNLEIIEAIAVFRRFIHGNICLGPGVEDILHVTSKVILSQAPGLERELYQKPQISV